MDIITHTLSGIAIGSVVAGFQQMKAGKKIGILGLSAFGAMLPDIDAISMWSKFDTTIGKLFHLQHSGTDIYTAKFWYSHHGFMHSIIASLLILFILSAFFYFVSAKRKGIPYFRFISDKRLLGIGFVSGFVMHLLEDMPTPEGAWGGINLFWPSDSYTGGFGFIWWWNNYDIFLIVAAVCILNILLIFSRWQRKFVVVVSLLIFISGFSAGCYNIKHRNFNFNEVTRQRNYTYLDKKSLEIQHQLLGDKVYNAMNWFDNHVKLNF